MLLATAGCSPGDTDVGPAAGSAIGESSGGTANGKSDEKTGTWAGALANASAVEHKALTSENRAYQGLLDDQGATGPAQMDAWGYPSPEELLRTFQESDESLKRRADAGECGHSCCMRTAWRCGWGRAGPRTTIPAITSCWRPDLQAQRPD